MLRPDFTPTPPWWYTHRRLLSLLLLSLIHCLLLSLIFLPPSLEGRYYLLLWLALLDLEVLSSALRYSTYFLERSAKHRAFAVFWLDLTVGGLVMWGGNDWQRWMGVGVGVLTGSEVWHGLRCARQMRRGSGTGGGAGERERRESEGLVQEVPSPFPAKPVVDGVDRSL